MRFTGAIGSGGTAAALQLVRRFSPFAARVGLMAALSAMTAAANGLEPIELLSAPAVGGVGTAFEPSPGLPVCRSAVTLDQQYLRLPLAFEPGICSDHPHGRFSARGRGYWLSISPAEVVVTLRLAQTTPAAFDRPGAAATRNATRETRAGQRSATLRMRLIGASRDACAVAEDLLPGKVNRLVGKDPAQWRTGLPRYARVRYPAVYPGVDVVYYGDQSRLEYDLIVAPGASPDVIRLGFDGVERTELSAEGDLVLHAASGKVILQKPVVFQEVGGTRKTLEGRYVIGQANDVGFELAKYDATRPLIIDPILSYAGYLGGAGREVAWDIAVDAAGHLYVAGETESAAVTGFTLVQTNAFQTNYGGGSAIGGDAFVAKLSANGSAVEYFTYLGGSGSDGAFGLTVDGEGHAYLAGFTTSTNFPVSTNAFQASIAGTPHTNSGAYPLDGFVAKLSPDGSQLLYSTYLGGSDADMALDVAINAAGDAFLGGQTVSLGFPGVLTNSLQAAYAGGAHDGFIVKLDRTGSQVTYATYFGGHADDSVQGIAVDADDNVFATGLSFSTNLPLANASQSTHAGAADAFVAKLTADGATLAYSTYLGGESDDYGLRIVVDGNGNAALTGQTFSTDFPAVNALQPTNSGGWDAFAARLDPTGARQFSTYLGGNGADIGWSIAVDNQANVFLAGETTSTDFPGVTADSILTARSGATNAFVVELSADGSRLAYATYLGGTTGDTGHAITVDSAGSLYVAGQTLSSDLLLTNAFQPTYGGGGDAWVAKLESAQVPSLAVEIVDGQVVISWPAPLAEFALQFTESLSPPAAWQSDTNSVVVANQRNRVTVPAGGQARFYRLVQGL